MKKFVALLTLLTLILSFSIQSYAVSPVIKVPTIKIPEININNIELPDNVKDAINESVKEDIKNLDIKLLTTPQITENRYIHSRVFWDKNRLQIKWNTINEATSYEIKVKKKDGSEKIYTTTYTYLIVNKNEDDFITDCVMGGTVKIRAVKDNGSVYSLWTDEDTIACNKIFH